MMESRADTIVLPSDCRRLRTFNGLMAAVHLTQGILILLLSTDFSSHVTTAFLTFDKAADKLVTSNNTIFDLRLAPLIACFLFISALDHLLLTLPGIYPWYARNLRRGINYARWWEYAASAALMMAVIAMLTGLYDVGGLIMVFTLTAMMILCGLLMEMQNHATDQVNWAVFYLGCLAGLVPWIVVGLYLLSPGTPGHPPTFVYFIYISLFLFFNCFAVNMFLQYKKIGPWRDYLHGERVYILLSLTAKSALAWQVFAGTLRNV